VPPARPEWIDAKEDQPAAAAVGSQRETLAAARGGIADLDPVGLLRKHAPARSKDAEER
jgi:hypothetical protein